MPRRDRAGRERAVVGPNRLLSDPQFLQRASQSELRRTAHDVLRYPYGNDHDACLALLRVGDATSVPYLQRAIRRQQGKTPGLMECTEAHCREALDRILHR